MSDFLIKRMQMDISDMNLRIQAHDEILVDTKSRMDRYGHDLDMLKMIHESQKENNTLVAEIAEYAKQTLEIVRSLGRIVRWISILAKWIALVGASVTFIWHGAKIVYGKVAVFF